MVFVLVKFIIVGRDLRPDRKLGQNTCHFMYHSNFVI